MKCRLISYLLWLANSRPPIDAEAFYRMKTRLLHRYGRRVGQHVQHVAHTCWECHGSGSREDGSKHPCWKCGGSGQFRQFWSYLDVWKLGPRTFHIPVGRTWSYPGRTDIEGIIKHEDVGWAAREAQFWLALFFDWHLLYRLTKSCACGRYWYPLMNLNRVYWFTRDCWRRTKRLMHNRRIVRKIARFNEDTPF